MADCVLVTGGAGYVGTHTVVELLNSGYEVVVLDNLVNASMASIGRVEKITGKKVKTYQADLLDKESLKSIFKAHKISLVMHLAGLKAVGESVQLPLLYYHTNVGGTVNLLEVMKEFGVKNIIFSSSATVYGLPQYLPVDENHVVGGCTNAYGKTKYFIEEIIRDLNNSDKEWNAVILRYFNPVGAHESGDIGENPQGVPNNLMPYVSQVAVGRLPQLTVYGNDYDTKDGTGVRDYIHIVDLALGHVAAIKKIKSNCGFAVFNLGTGVGYSVLDMVNAFEKATGKKIPYKIAERRSGDIASVYAATDKAAADLGWKATRGLDKMSSNRLLIGNSDTCRKCQAAPETSDLIALHYPVTKLDGGYGTVLRAEEDFRSWADEMNLEVKTSGGGSRITRMATAQTNDDYNK